MSGSSTLLLSVNVIHCDGSLLPAVVSKQTELCYLPLVVQKVRVQGGSHRKRHLGIGSLCLRMLVWQIMYRHEVPRIFEHEHVQSVQRDVSGFLSKHILDNIKHTCFSVMTPLCENIVDSLASSNLMHQAVCYNPPMTYIIL